MLPARLSDYRELLDYRVVGLAIGSPPEELEMNEITYSHDRNFNSYVHVRV